MSISITGRHHGLIAAALTPLAQDGSFNDKAVVPMVDRLISEGVRGLYVCGSTGEGVSLTTAERKSVAEAFVSAAAGRIPVFVQVGHNSLRDAADLAQHAASIGADNISATCPNYFKVGSIEVLVDCMLEIANAAPDRPFYYYHIPSLTGNQLSMPKFLHLASERIPNLAGIKYTTPELHVFEQCQRVLGSRFEIFWGTDEMLLPALAGGAKAAIGSTYNIAATLYNRIIDAFAAGEIDAAREMQALVIDMIAVLLDYPFHAAMKHVMRLRGMELGPCRLPQVALTEEQADALEARLRKIGYFDWSQT